MAHYVVADGKWTARIPEHMAFSEAAVIPTAGVTALAAVKKIGPLGGKHILVCGASGGVGQYATLFASHAGAVVDAACGASNAAIPKRCGAARVFGYESGIANLPAREYDVIVAVNGRFSASDYARLLKAGGVFVAVGMDSIRPALVMPFEGVRVKAAVFFAEMRRGGLADAVERASAASSSIALCEHHGLACSPEVLCEVASKRTGVKHVVLI